MRVLFIGDVVGTQGCDFLCKNLPALKKHIAADIVIVNGENSASGNGILPSGADLILDYGADLITLGNHALRRREIYDYLDNENNPIIRPYNYHLSAPGRGSAVIQKGKFSLGVINMMGSVYMEDIDNPFNYIDSAIAELKNGGCKCILMDFHAEATGEKRAMGFYVDGKISAMVGTHTHTPTADEQILPQGTAYISDVGMTGPIDSCLGIKKELAIEKMKTLLPVRFENPDTACYMQCVIIDIDEATGLSQAIERLEIR